MTAKQLFHSLVLILLGSTLFGCGGGGGGGLVSGIGGTGITASGTITGFGSIFVNGVEFETGAAEVTLDDNTGSEGDLRLGMVVRVQGTVDDSGTRGTASKVEFDDDVQGPLSGPIVAGPDGLSSTFTVLGVGVRADGTKTVFDGVSLDTLAVNDWLEVSGFFDGAGVLQATRIEKKGDFQPTLSEVELKGTVSGLSGTSFTLGSFTVEFAGADLSRVPGGVITDGLPVEVKGTLSGTTITANRIAQEDDLFGDDEAKVSLEGIVSNFVSNSSFTVAGQAVNASAAIFEPAGLVLADGVEVEVEGPIVAGVLQAVKVEARGGNIKLEARVSAVNNPPGTLTLQFAPGTLNVVVDSRTTLRDDTGVDDSLTLNEIVATDFLEVEAFRDDSSGALIATEIRRDTLDDDILQGPLDACAADTSVTLLGLTYTLLAGTTEYQDQNDAPISGTTFCSAANSGGFFIKIRDDLAPDGIADEAELED